MTDPRLLNDLGIQNHNALYGPALNTNRETIGPQRPAARAEMTP